MNAILLRTVALASSACLALFVSSQSLAQIPTFPIPQKPVEKPKPKPTPTNQYQIPQYQIQPMIATKVAMLDGQLDGSLVRPDGTALFFVNDNYAGYDIANRKLDFTRAHDLVGVPKDIDAALLHPINRKGYFFKGNTYYRYNFFTKKKDKTGTIGKSGWKGISGPIDAVLAHPYNNHVYFFKGNKFQKFSLRTKKVVDTGTIGVDDWIGIPEDIDGAFLHSNGKAYFFKSDTYHRFDFINNRRDKKRIVGKDGWRGVAFSKDNRATENTNPLARENVRLKVTLVSMKAHKINDMDNIGDLAFFQNVHYSARNKNKTFTERTTNTLAKPEIVFSTDGQNDGEHVLITGTKQNRVYNGFAMNWSYDGSTATKLKQFHIAAGQTKQINNSLVFNVSTKEANDRGASFYFKTNIQELDDCGEAWVMKLVDSGCDAQNIASRAVVHVNIHDVLKYLKNPNGVPDDFFNQDGFLQDPGKLRLTRHSDRPKSALVGTMYFASDFQRNDKGYLGLGTRESFFSSENSVELKVRFELIE